ncbi:hypothetical protein [Marinimicrobium sp. C2-29]|uniref:hypothetical protein n=1 Tax=Marinimicrobium sp. C2-29 TaxID=3139825 RepID=UPI00313A1238
MQFDPENRPSWRQIVSITGVSERTARRWLTEGAPTYAVRLIDLERRGRIIPESWPEDFKFNHGGYFESGNHQPAYNWQQLTWLKYIVSCWYEALEAVRLAQASIDYLTDKLPRAEVLELEAHRERLREIERQRRVSVAEAVALASERTG